MCNVLLQGKADFWGIQASTLFAGWEGGPLCCSVATSRKGSSYSPEVHICGEQTDKINKQRKKGREEIDWQKTIGK